MNIVNEYLHSLDSWSAILWYCDKLYFISQCWTTEDILDFWYIPRYLYLLSVISTDLFRQSLDPDWSASPVRVQFTSDKIFNFRLEFVKLWNLETYFSSQPQSVVATGQFLPISPVINLTQNSGLFLYLMCLEINLNEAAVSGVFFRVSEVSQQAFPV